MTGVLHTSLDTGLFFANSFIPYHVKALQISGESREERSEEERGEAEITFTLLTL